jgi:hypothetical protein
VKALKIIFEGVNWVEKDGTTISLQSGLLTNAKARAYIYFGPSWKHADSSPDYLVPTKKIKAKPALKADSFFDNGKALDEAIYLDPHTDPIEVNGDDDIDNLAMQARQLRDQPKPRRLYDEGYREEKTWVHNSCTMLQSR